MLVLSKKKKKNHASVLGKLKENIIFAKVVDTNFLTIVYVYIVHTYTVHVILIKYSMSTRINIFYFCFAPHNSSTARLVCMYQSCVHAPLS